jgi:hypothetical protein
MAGHKQESLVREIVPRHHSRQRGFYPRSFSFRRFEASFHHSDCEKSRNGCQNSAKLADRRPTNAPGLIADRNREFTGPTSALVFMCRFEAGLYRERESNGKATQVHFSLIYGLQGHDGYAGKRAGSLSDYKVVASKRLPYRREKRVPLSPFVSTTTSTHFGDGQRTCAKHTARIALSRQRPVWPGRRPTAARSGVQSSGLKFAKRSLSEQRRARRHMPSPKLSGLIDTLLPSTR